MDWIDVPKNSISLTLEKYSLMGKNKLLEIIIRIILYLTIIKIFVYLALLSKDKIRIIHFFPNIMINHDDHEYSRKSGKHHYRNESID